MTCWEMLNESVRPVSARSKHSAGPPRNYFSGLSLSLPVPPPNAPTGYHLFITYLFEKTPYTSHLPIPRKPTPSHPFEFQYAQCKTVPPKDDSKCSVIHLASQFCSAQCWFLVFNEQVAWKRAPLLPQLVILYHEAVIFLLRWTFFKQIKRT